MDLVSFDENYRARLLDPEKFKNSETLQRECEDFVAKSGVMSRQLEVFLRVLEQKGEGIERDKLRAIGHRNRVEGQGDARKKAQKELETLVAERQAQLDRLTVEYESLMRIEQEQRVLLEKLSRNEL